MIVKTPLRTPRQGEPFLGFKPKAERLQALFEDGEWRDQWHLLCEPYIGSKTIQGLLSLGLIEIKNRDFRWIGPDPDLGDLWIE